MNVHLHATDLEHASRILRSMGAAGASGCYSSRKFVGAGREFGGHLTDPHGDIGYKILYRDEVRSASVVGKIVATVAWSRRASSLISGYHPSCINCHGLSTLPLSVRLKRQLSCRLIYDTHELEACAAAIRGVRRLWAKPLERALIGACDAVVCVTDSIADWYAREYGIQRPVVIRNLPDLRNRREIGDRSVLRRRFGIPDSATVFIYQGGLFQGRRVEQLVRVFQKARADRHIVFMGYGGLEVLVRETAARYANVHFLPAVPPEEVLDFTAGADVGIVGVENRCLSYYYSLPNKLFEYLKSGLAILTPAYPEMLRIVKDADCGWSVGEADNHWLQVINALSNAEVCAKKEMACVAASRYLWENEEIKLINLYRQVM